MTRGLVAASAEEEHGHDHVAELTNAGPSMRSTVRTSVALGACLAIVSIAASACTAAPASTPSTTTATDAAADASCVASPETVATAELPAGATDPLDEATVDELRLAAEEGFDLASAPGAVVGVRTPDGTWTEAFGEADPAAGTPMETIDFLRVGSITKTFTGSLILQLAERGELSLDDTIDQYVDGVPNGGEVTLRMLIDMTSGIASYTLDENVANTYLSAPTTVWTPDQLLDAAFGLDPLFAPGAEFNYSNTNFILLGKVIEKVTSDAYPDVLEERILEPLGLDDTSFPDTSELPDPHAQGFSLQGTPDDSHEPVIATDWSPTFAWTAGQMISTIDDMLDWGRVLVTGQGILDEDMSIERLTSFHGEESYGYAAGCIDGWVGHTGEIPGYNASVFHNAAEDITVVALTNSDIPSGDCSASKTLADNTEAMPCMAPATRIFVAIAEALGHQFTPPPAS